MATTHEHDMSIAIEECLNSIASVHADPSARLVGMDDTGELYRVTWVDANGLHSGTVTRHLEDMPGGLLESWSATRIRGRVIGLDMIVHSLVSSGGVVTAPLS